MRGVFSTARRRSQTAMNREDANARLSSDDDAAAAAEWVMRLDRGLSPDEQDSYLQWLAADVRHGEAIARQRRTWEAFDRLAGLQSSVEAVPDPDLLVPRGGRSVADGKTTARLNWMRTRALPVGLAAAAVCAFMFWSRTGSITDETRAPAVPPVAGATRFAP